MSYREFSPIRVDMTQGYLPVSDSIRTEFRDEITPRRLANAGAVFDVLELLGRQHLLDTAHVERLKTHVPQACKEYVDYMFGQLGRGHNNPEFYGGNSENRYAWFHARQLRDAAFVRHKELMFEFLLLELAGKSWRQMGEWLRMSAEFLDSVDNNGNYSTEDARFLAVMRHFENTDDEDCLPNQMECVLYRFGLPEAVDRMEERLQELVEADGPQQWTINTKGL